MKIEYKPNMTTDKVCKNCGHQMVKDKFLGAYLMAWTLICPNCGGKECE